MRNQNHRESLPTGKQKKTLNSIIGKEGKYFLKFHGFLEDFISQVEQSISTQTLPNENNTLNKASSKSKFSNSLGDDPKIASLLEKLRKNDI